ncbi:MAG: IS110 family transposase [Chloroflexi bacterium]|nr:IS110 family transposase [Chloroflexota bacterium]
MTTSAIIVSTNNQDPRPRPERIYVGIDLGYREHVAAATPLAAFSPQHRPEGWKRVKTLKFSSDAAGYQRLQRYLDRVSTDVADFLVLLEPTGGYYGLSLILFLLGKDYRVLQVDNRTVREYREKVFGLETKTDDVDARLMARMGFLHEMVGEEFSIRPVHLVDGDAAALRVMVRDLEKLTREITRRRNQLQQIAAATFPEFKTFFRDSTAGSAARALLAHFPTPQTLAEADTDEVAEVLHSARAHSHAKRAAELQDLARSSAGVLMLSHHQWRRGWIIRQLDALEQARAELLDQIRQVLAKHPYARIIESLPVKSPVWTATLIAAIGDIKRFQDHRQFKRYLGWTPEIAKSGSSVDTSKLARGGVRSARGALGQMALILLAPNVRDTPFREDYRRMVARHVRPATATGHLAGKLSTVLYGMLRTMTVYDEAKHRREMSLPLLHQDNVMVEPPIEIEMDIVDDIELPNEQDNEGLATRESV